jgi:membrane protein required for colicin V production
MIGAAAVIFLFALIIISFITMRIADFIIDSSIGALDRTLGFVFGAARGLLIVVVAMLFFNWLVEPEQRPVWVNDAKSKPLLDSLGARLVAVLPQNLGETVLERIKGKAKTPSATVPADTVAEPDAAEDVPAPKN